MEKTPRYTQRERNMVLGYAAQYKDVIENKRTDAESNRKKDEVWRQIAKEFNARVYHQRTSKQLRQLYKNMKLLLKKDLCGEGKGNRSFMDLLNTLSQQESVAQYIAEQMSPTGSYNNSRQQKYEEDYDDNKLASRAFNDAMDTGVIVIKSEEMSDNDQTSHNGDMDDDDDDCLSTKDIPEVCLEEEDDEIFMADLRQTLQQRSQLHISNAQNNQQQQNQQQQQSSPPQPEVTIQNVGGIRVGSIGSMANLQLKALQNSLSNYNSHGNSNSINNNNNNIHNNNNNNNNSNNNNPAISITQANSGNSNNGSNIPNHVSQRQTQQLQHQLQQHQQQSAAEQAQQNLLLNGLGLSAVVHQSTTPHATSTPPLEHTAAGLLSTLPGLQRAGLNSNANNTNGLSAAANQILMSLNGGGNGNFGHHKSSSHKDTLHTNNSSNGHNSGSGRNNDYLMSLAIEERKRKIDLLNAQIDYWKTLTKMLDANGGHNPTPSCLCHFPGKVNGLQTQTSTS